MKYIYPSVVAIMFASNALAGAAPMINHLYSNSIVGTNIVNIQNAIAQNAIDRFGHKIAMKSYVAPVAKVTDKSDPDIYGKMRVYGEFGDDGTVFGRSAGDMDVENNVWLNWNHFNGYMNFDDFGKIDTRSNIIMAGTSDDFGFGNFGVFGGYVGSVQDGAYDIDLSENSGFVGVFDGFNIGGFSLDALADAGVMFTKSKLVAGEDEFANIWVGAGLNISYDVRIDDSFYMQPFVYGGYTWVRTPNYMSVSNDYVVGQNFNSLNLIPGVKFVKNVIGDWYGTANVKYVVSSNHGGVANIAGVAVDRLDYGNHTEYNIGVEKHIDGFDLSLNIGRSDGAYTGWQGSATVKYVF